MPDVLIIEPSVYKDDRGYFMETWNQRAFTEAGNATRFVQDKYSL
ncbi:dTDP-4-dehydrorhamnose 3,5-epimerase family protein [Natronogracilivirga saccharolytica]|uniref:dTDP-4-dehydrorhamnose 3,5-epimerase n=1 Tax=Natronogracilivirga saccharolytica TaxID=2812953 RepID=A0A8J7UXY6_9BACT|nr:dTDP-4-dehydrorhamnose 3,5-epimerase family protein [Natronogracilivirga saccharolytica]